MSRHGISETTIYSVLLLAALPGCIIEQLVNLVQVCNFQTSGWVHECLSRQQQISVLMMTFKTKMQKKIKNGPGSKFSHSNVISDHVSVSHVIAGCVFNPVKEHVVLQQQLGNMSNEVVRFRSLAI